MSEITAETNRCASASSLVSSKLPQSVPFFVEGIVFLEHVQNPPVCHDSLPPCCCCVSFCVRLRPFFFFQSSAGCCGRRRLFVSPCATTFTASGCRMHHVEERAHVVLLFMCVVLFWSISRSRRLPARHCL